MAICVLSSRLAMSELARLSSSTRALSSALTVCSSSLIDCSSSFEVSSSSLADCSSSFIEDSSSLPDFSSSLEDSSSSVVVCSRSRVARSSSSSCRSVALSPSSTVWCGNSSSLWMPPMSWKTTMKIAASACRAAQRMDHQVDRLPAAVGADRDVVLDRDLPRSRPPCARRRAGRAAGRAAPC